MKRLEIIEKLTDGYWLMKTDAGICLCHNYREDGEDKSRFIGIFPKRKEAIRTYELRRSNGSK